MLRYAADENFNNDILRGLRRRNDLLDVVRVQDVELYGVLDPIILDWAARENRVVLSHDVSTMIGFAYDRVEAGQPMPEGRQPNREPRTRRPLGMSPAVHRRGSWPTSQAGHDAIQSQ